MAIFMYFAKKFFYQFNSGRLTASRSRGIKNVNKQMEDVL
jgi:hypothetical protein